MCFVAYIPCAQLYLPLCRSSSDLMNHVLSKRENTESSFNREIVNGGALILYIATQ